MSQIIHLNIKLTLTVIFTLFLAACSSSGSDDPSVLISDTPKSVNEKPDPGTGIPVAKAAVYSSIEGNGVLRFPGQQSCSSSCKTEYERNSNITITATANQGYKFSGWEGACSGSNTTCSLKLNDNKTLEATFVRLMQNLSLKNNGEGSIAISANGLSCFNECNIEFYQGQSIILVAAAKTGYKFTGWSGDSCTGTSTCTISLNADMQVIANYEKVDDTVITPPKETLYTLTAKVAENRGYIEKINNGKCGTQCSEQKPEGSKVTLTASPKTGFEFDRWSGACTTNANQCSFTLNQDVTVTAIFKPIAYTGKVDVVGKGSVSVLGETCRSSCSLSLEHGTTLTLKATADTGYKFKQWSGGCSGTNTQCTVSITQATNVQAEFIITQQTLTTAVKGAGSISGSGITCNSSSCSSTHDFGTKLSLTATPNNGYKFSGWTGACQGDGECTITMDQANTVTATFNAIEYALTTQITGQGSVSGNGISCAQSSCLTQIKANSEITLTPTAADGYVFSNWAGACSGQSTTCTIKVNKNESVSAIFTEQSISYNLSIPGTKNGSLNVDINGDFVKLCGVDGCNLTLAENDTVKLTPQADDGYEFGQWTQDCEQQGANSDSCSITATSDINAGVVFTALVTGSNQATVSWDIPDSRENGDDLPLSEIGGYEILYKHSSEATFKSVIVDDPGQQEVVINELIDGEYQFKIASFDIDGLYSEYSDLVFKRF